MPRLTTRCRAASRQGCPHRKRRCSRARRAFPPPSGCAGRCGSRLAPAYRPTNPLLRRFARDAAHGKQSRAFRVPEVVFLLLAYVEDQPVRLVFYDFPASSKETFLYFRSMLFLFTSLSAAESSAAAMILLQTAPGSKPCALFPLTNARLRAILDPKSV